MTLDGHFAAPHGVAPYGAGLADEVRAARESETILEVFLLWNAGRETLHPLRDFNQALFALPLLTAGRGYGNAERFCVVKDRAARRNGNALPVNVKINTHVCVLFSPSSI